MLVCIGSYWPVLAQVSPIGHYGLLLVFIGPASSYWPLRVPIGVSWFLLVTVGSPRPPIIYMGLYPFVPAHLDLYWSVLIYIGCTSFVGLY